MYARVYGREYGREQWKGNVIDEASYCETMYAENVHMYVCMYVVHMNVLRKCVPAMLQSN